MENAGDEQIRKLAFKSESFKYQNKKKQRNKKFEELTNEEKLIDVQNEQMENVNVS